MERGRNSGLTGLIDLPGISATAKFQVRILRWAPRLTGGTRPRRGRGSGVWAATRWTFSSGTIACSGKLNLDGWPSPTLWKGQAGTVTVQVAAGKTVSYPIQVTEAGFSYDEKTLDLPDVSIAATVTGEPTFTGWTTGSQPSATDPTRADQEQYEGTNKTIDPDGLQSGAVRIIDIWGTLGDNDASEQTKLLTVITNAAAPLTTPHNAKLRSATFARDALDGGTITLTYGLTTTAEDQINAATAATADPQWLADTATTAAINATPAAPSDSNLVSRGTRTTELNDSNNLKVTEWGTRSTKSDIEYPGTPTTTDADNIGDSATITLVTDSGTPPVTPAAPVGVLVSSKTVRENDRRWRHSWDYANTTSSNRIVYDGSQESVDPTNLDDQERITVVNTSSTPPATPTPTNGALKLRERLTQRVQQTPTKWKHTFIFDRTTTAEDQLNANTNAIVDPQGLRDTASTAAINGVPAAPADTDLVSRGTKTTELNDANNLSVTDWGTRSTAADITYPGTPTEVADSNIGDSASITQVTTSGTAPAAPAAPIGVLVSTRSVQDNVRRWVHTFKYANTTEANRIIYENNRVQTDPSSLEDDERITLINTSSTPPADPSPSIAALKKREVLSVRIQQTPEKWRHTFMFARTTTGEDVVNRETTTIADASALESRATSAAINGVPAAPSPAELVQVSTTTKELNDANTLTTYGYATKTSQEEVEFQSVTDDDPQNLADRTVVVKVTDSSTPADPATYCPANFVHRSTESQQLTHAGKWRHSYTYTRTNTQEDIEYAESPTETDPSGLEDETRSTTITASASPPAPSAPSGLKHYRTITVRKTNAGLYKHTLVYRKQDAEDRLEMGASTAGASYGEGMYVEDSTVIAATAGQTNYQLAQAQWNTYKGWTTVDHIRVQKLNDTKALLTIRSHDNMWVAKAESYSSTYESACLWDTTVNPAVGKVYLAEKYQRGGLWYFLIDRPTLFHIQKKITISLIKSHFGTPAWLDNLHGTTNLGTFLGFPQGTVAFQGAGIVDNLKTTVPRAYGSAYDLIYDSSYWMDTSNIQAGWHLTTTDLSAVSLGWVAATTFGWTLALIPTASYAGILP